MVEGLPRVNKALGSLSSNKNKRKGKRREGPRRRIRTALIKYLLFLFRCVYLCVCVSEGLMCASTFKGQKKASALWEVQVQL